jgi:methionine--tRNA ligase beta chain
MLERPSAHIAVLLVQLAAMRVKASLLLVAIIPAAQPFSRCLLARKCAAQPMFRKLCTLGGTDTSQPSQRTEQTNKSPDPLELLEIRIGRITEIGKHPDGDSLYVEKVDLGEPAGPRTIVSGLVEYCTTEYLLNRDVVVLCNLKPRALKGIVSEGMLLCASDKAAGKVGRSYPTAQAMPSCDYCNCSVLG